MDLCAHVCMHTCIHLKDQDTCFEKFGRRRLVDVCVNACVCVRACICMCMHVYASSVADGWLMCV